MPTLDSPRHELLLSTTEARLPPWTRQLLRCLAPGSRAVFVLRQARVPFHEVAGELGLPPAEVRNLYADAERLLIDAASRGARSVPRPTPADLTPVKPSPRVPPEMLSLLDTACDELETCVRTTHELDRQGVRVLGQLVRTPVDVAAKRIGRRATRELVHELAKLGLGFGMSVGRWRTPEERRLGVRGPLPSAPRRDRAAW